MHQIRSITSDDVDRCVEFGLEAFRPVFASFKEHYGEGLFNALRPNWETAQSDYIREACSERDTWVALLGEQVESGLGEIELMAVDPEFQGRGVGTALTEFGVTQLRESGMTHAIVGTGNDPSDAPARRVHKRRFRTDANPTGAAVAAALRGRSS